jgi:hypothetical protein
MTDVRLTALNPEDSTVVPVACNSSGELLVDKGAQGPDLNVEGDLSVDGSASFASSITAAGRLNVGDSATNTGGLVTLNQSIASSGALFLRGVVAGDTDNPKIMLRTDGSSDFAGSITAAGFILNGGDLGSNTASGCRIEDGVIYAQRPAGSTYSVFGGYSGTTRTTKIGSDGSAVFKGDVIVSSRSKSWMLVEQGGLCHMVEQTRSLIDDGFSVDADADEYPKLRDVFNELDLIERSLSQVMEKLRLTPPAGWPVWDGSDETQ